MAINFKASPTKDLLERSSIRTMRKDLAMLRERDSLQEKQKISKIHPIKSAADGSLSNTGNSRVSQGGVSQDTEQLQPLIEKEAGQNLSPLPNSSREAKIPANQNNYQPELNAPQEEKIQPPVNLPVDGKGSLPESERQDKLGKILKPQTYQDSFKHEGQNVKPEDLIGAEAKDHASETEKQQIFLLKSQKANLENQIKEGNLKNGPSLVSEKNKLLSEKKNWQEKLDYLLQEEEKNEQEQAVIGKKEEESDVPAEKQKLEQEKLAKEEQKETIEKKRWSIESELAKLEQKVKNLDENNRQSEIFQENIKKEITEIDGSLKAIYDDILKRAEAREDLSGQTGESKQAFAPKSENPIMAEDKGQAPKMPVKNILKDAEYLRAMSPLAKEKLEKSAEIEEERRVKFMEDVERWVASAKAKEQENKGY